MRVVHCVAVIGYERQEEVAQRNWTIAVQTYRAALTTYRRLAESRMQRATLRTAPLVLANGSVPRAAMPSVPLRLEGLTPREREVAELIARGCSNQQIANQLVLTRGTVANHVAHILEKLAVTNRTQVAAVVLGQTERRGG